MAGAPTRPTDPAGLLSWAKELKAYRLVNEKYRYYEPSGVAEDFINAFASDDYFILFLSAANGVGKTALATNIIANLAFSGDNPWFRGKLFEDWQYLKRGRIVTESDLVEKNVVNAALVVLTCLVCRVPVLREPCFELVHHVLLDEV